jgi:hypothetical protein
MRKVFVHEKLLGDLKDKIDKVVCNQRPPVLYKKQYDNTPVLGVTEASGEKSYAVYKDGLDGRGRIGGVAVVVKRILSV